jgi:hypothetical protein
MLYQWVGISSSPNMNLVCSIVLSPFKGAGRLQEYLVDSLEGAKDEGLLKLGLRSDEKKLRPWFLR